MRYPHACFGPRVTDPGSGLWNAREVKSDLPFILENANWPAILLDGTGNIRRANPAAIQFFGAVLGGEGLHLKTIWGEGNPTTAEAFLQRWTQAPVPVMNLSFKVKGGAQRPYATSLCVSGRDEHKLFTMQVSLADPALTAVENAAAQKQKLDCALKLTRAVALDFNNALTSILGHTSHVLGQMEHGHPWRPALLEVEKSAERGAEIAHDLAAFSLQEKDSKAQTAGNLNTLLRRAVEAFQNSGPPEISWLLELEPKLFSVTFDEAKMAQAFSKLLENSVQAIVTEGKVKVRTLNRMVKDADAGDPPSLAPGRYVCVEIEDNGSGIPSDILPRIFEPFFTTKPGHRGLGLAWVYGIITNHGGCVAVTSEPGLGARVRVFLPAQSKLVKDEGIEDKNLGGAETILLVDDEEIILTMGQMILSSFGYRVLTAKSGKRALEIFQEESGLIDLLVTDLVMPNMSGRELIEHWRRLSPDARILSMSGYVRSSKSGEEESYLQKPFTSQGLLRKVKQVLS